MNYDNTARTITWIGAAVINKPIGDFHITTPGSFNGNRPGNGVLRSWTDHTQNNGLRIRVYGAVIPEPEEYALVFALFAPGFVVVRRHFQRKRRQQAATS